MNPRTKCVIITGRPGSGKSTLARKVREALYMPLVSRDEIKEGFVSSLGVKHDCLPSATNGDATAIFFSIVQTLLEKNVSVVAEAAFQHKVWAHVVPQWARVSELHFVICAVDPEVAAQRHLQRGLDDPHRGFFHGDKRVEVFKETGEFLPPGEYVPPSFEFPTLEVNTTNGYDPDVSGITDFIGPPRIAQQDAVGNE